MDRRKDMIISGGFNIYPSDLEAVLRSTRRWPTWRWSACQSPNGAKRRWPSWCAGPGGHDDSADEPCASG
jgi:acyl-CoA synthetase (AMP-forming)/AMP-acid ligase II